MQTTENCAPPFFHRSLLQEWNEESQFHWVGLPNFFYTAGQMHVLDEHFADTSWGVVHAVYQRYTVEITVEMPHEDEEIRWKLVGMTVTTDKDMQQLVGHPQPLKPSSTGSASDSTTS
jgi:hypothetical protein